MTPAARQKLLSGLAIIAEVNDADAWDTRTDEARERLIEAGAAFVDGNTNTMRLGGVTASCTFHKGEHLLLRWAANARKKLAETDPADAASEEEE